jgi:hypothetical protein
MASNQTLQLGQNTVQVGLGTLTFTVPATVSSLNTPVVNIPFSVRCQVSVPNAAQQGSQSGSGLDGGNGASGGKQGIGQGSNLSLGNGGLGLGSGAGASSDDASLSGYPQASAVNSGLSIVVKQNGTTVFTAPAFPTASRQGALQFKTTLLCNAADVLTVVFSSSTASDEQLQGINANVSVQQGM